MCLVESDQTFLQASSSSSFSLTDTFLWFTDYHWINLCHRWDSLSAEKKTPKKSWLPRCCLFSNPVSLNYWREKCQKKQIIFKPGGVQTSVDSSPLFFWKIKWAGKYVWSTLYRHGEKTSVWSCLVNWTDILTIGTSLNTSGSHSGSS